MHPICFLVVCFSPLFLPTCLHTRRLTAFINDGLIAGMFVRVGNAPTKYSLPDGLFSPADVSLDVACSVLPDPATLQQTQPVRLGDYKKKDVYAGIHKRVAYVVHGDGTPIFLPQNSISNLTLADAIKYINKPPKFRFPTKRKWK